MFLDRGDRELPPTTARPLLGGAHRRGRRYQKSSSHRHKTGKWKINIVTGETQTGILYKVETAFCHRNGVVECAGNNLISVQGKMKEINNEWLYEERRELIATTAPFETVFKSLGPGAFCDTSWDRGWGLIW